MYCSTERLKLFIEGAKVVVAFRQMFVHRSLTICGVFKINEISTKLTNYSFAGTAVDYTPVCAEERT